MEDQSDQRPCSHLLSKANPSVKPSPHSSATSSKHVQPGQGGLHTLNTKLELCHVARELLSKGEGGGVLSVGTAYLDNVGILLGFCIQSIMQFLNARNQHIVDFHSNRDVHGGGVGVVAALRLINVVIRMNWSL